MPTLFTRIINGEIPCHKLMEDDQFLSFLDIRPIAPGHALVIPKKEVDYIFDVDDQTLGEMLVFAKKVAGKIRKSVPCKRVGVMVAGIEVPHAHIHLVPINDVHDLAFANAKAATPEELSETAARIRAA